MFPRDLSHIVLQKVVSLFFEVTISLQEYRTVFKENEIMIQKFVECTFQRIYLASFRFMS